MKYDRERQLLAINPSQLTGEQFKDIVTAVVKAVPDAEIVADPYNGLAFQRPDVVMPAEWIEGQVSP